MQRTFARIDRRRQTLLEMLSAGEVVKATPGKALNMVFLLKNLGNAVFDEAHDGALEAAKELQNPDELQYLAPVSGAAGAEQIPIITNATTQGVDAIMITKDPTRDAGLHVLMGPFNKYNIDNIDQAVSP